MQAPTIKSQLPLYYQQHVLPSHHGPLQEETVQSPRTKHLNQHKRFPSSSNFASHESPKLSSLLVVTVFFVCFFAFYCWFIDNQLSKIIKIVYKFLFRLMNILFYPKIGIFIIFIPVLFTGLEFLKSWYQSQYRKEKEKICLNRGHK